jgi:Protein of unknown function (DUF1501)
MSRRTVNNARLWVWATAVLLMGVGRVAPAGDRATVLHLLVLDHESLTYYHHGAQRRLTDVHGHVIMKIIA